ncbi:hypothetical protein BOTBODRAFT_163721 [Botryobasidium botryosum FD-172 SS1]|uniref:HNH nuclease domain-containing protein n=1 Tax=Botryobasidium botryosum (strain FD-172 SS1) TaxID=930990 RepID=A0A067M7B8_BOTB1|nr:hypothetical protein BOTBODRAFT_163721 [Botryobasidium botryosum FD-172 SS1]
MSDQANIQAAEARIQHYVPINTKTEDKTARLLFAILEHAPRRALVAQEISSCGTDAQLKKLADRYINGLIVPMRTNGGKTPAFSLHTSLASATENELHNENIFEAAKKKQNYTKSRAFLRDGNRCVVTKLLDEQFEVQAQAGEECVKTIATHIMPLSLLPSNTSGAEIVRSSRIFEVLDRFSGVGLDNFNGDKINSLDNVITLKMDLHAFFEDLAIWFEAVQGEENAYLFRKLPNKYTGVADRTKIVFTTDRPDVPLPNPHYLAVHAACAKVVHASGVAEVIDKVLRGLEDLPVLSNDGSSSDLLRAALAMVAVY